MHKDSFFRSKIFAIRPTAVLCVLALCTSCSTATKARLNIGWKNITSKISTKKPQEELLSKVNLPANEVSMQEKRLFMYRYYPELYKVIYEQRTAINPQSLVHWHAEANRQYDKRHTFGYNIDPQKLYRTK